MKRSFVHAYKKIIACTVIAAIIFATVENIYAENRGRKAIKHFATRNVSDITDEEKAELALLLHNFTTRAPRSDSRAPRDDAPAFDGAGDSEIVGASLDSGTLKLIQQCLCIIKNCVGQIKEAVTFDDDNNEIWASLIDKIACSVIDNPDLPDGLSDGQAQLAEALTEVLCRIGCPIAPGTIFAFLNIIFMKLCTVDSKIDVIDDKVCTIDSKIDVINDKVCTIDSKVDVIDDEIATLDSKIDAIDDKVCTIDSKVDVIDDEVEFAVSKLCIIDSKIDELFIDFQETWTILGANADPVPTPNAILDVNTTTTYTVLQWLKAIYHKVK